MVKKKKRHILRNTLIIIGSIWLILFLISAISGFRTNAIIKNNCNPTGEEGTFTALFDDGRTSLQCSYAKNDDPDNIGDLRLSPTSRILIGAIISPLHALGGNPCAIGLGSFGELEEGVRCSKASIFFDSSILD